jgi:microcystin degradation protein MlrC
MRIRLASTLATVTLLWGCQPVTEPAAPAAPEAEKLRFAVMSFPHETCTFCPGGDTTIDDWTKLRPPYIGDEVFNAGSYMRGFVAAAEGYSDVELVGLESPSGVYGGSSRSWNTEESFDHFVGIMLDDLREAMPVDGVYLALHGAMATRNIPRPEAEVARRFREVVGPDVPIVASFDLHGNEDEEFLRWADMAFITKRYPHYDAGLQGARSLHSLVRIARGLYKPATASRKPGVITPTVVQWTGKSPSMDIMERARRWESREKDVFVSVAYGFPWADVPDVGATVHVMTNDDQELAERIADDMSDFIWRVREGIFGEEYPQPAAAVELALRDERVLAELEANEAEVGDPFDMEVGGFAGEASGAPVRVTGTISYLGEGVGYDNIAGVTFGDGNTLLITPALKQVMWTEEIDFGPIDPDDFDVFVVKSRVHFRRGFDETGYAKSIYIVDVPDPHIGTTRLDALPYENVTLTDHYPYGTPPHRR